MVSKSQTVSIQPKPKKGLVVKESANEYSFLARFNPAEAEEGFSSIDASFVIQRAKKFQSSRSRRRV